MKRSFKDALPDVVCETRDAWRAWLAANHAISTGVWLVINKKGSGRPVLAYDDLVAEALCFGWVDSVPNKLDETRYRLMVTPRKPGSVWSAANKTRIARLLEAGLMAPAGLAALAAAKADGSWDALAASDALVPPPDLAAALAASPVALATFEAFSASSRKNILQYVLSAKRPETRARRIAETVALAAEGLRANYPVDLEKRRPKPV
jgi:uncharacterized protein YdeI (YjbR/CyaY-like superfamily)